MVGFLTSVHSCVIAACRHGLTPVTYCVVAAYWNGLTPTTRQSTASSRTAPTQSSAARHITAWCVCGTNVTAAATRCSSTTQRASTADTPVPSTPSPLTAGICTQLLISVLTYSISQCMAQQTRHQPSAALLVSVNLGSFQGSTSYICIFFYDCMHGRILALNHVS